VALLEKEHFPRDKYCGDAVCTPALRILEEMGVLQELVANNETHFADAGGFVSPAGLAYIGECCATMPTAMARVGGNMVELPSKVPVQRRYSMCWSAHCNRTHLPGAHNPQR
jgi:hypothetical protein